MVEYYFPEKEGLDENEGDDDVDVDDDVGVRVVGVNEKDGWVVVVAAVEGLERTNILRSTSEERYERDFSA